MCIICYIIFQDDSGVIDFREYVIGMSLIAMPANNEETIQLAFQVWAQLDLQTRN